MRIIRYLPLWQIMTYKNKSVYKIVADNDMAYLPSWPIMTYDR